MCNQSYSKFMFSKIVTFLNLNTYGHDEKIKNENNRDKHNGSSRSNKLCQMNIFKYMKSEPEKRSLAFLYL